MTKMTDTKIKQLTSIVEHNKDRMAHLEDELGECARMNDRLNKTIVTDREKITRLKEVARFYRAQRDRVDAYLSATLDSIDRASGRDRDCYDRASPLTPVGLIDSSPQNRRPTVREPYADSGDDDWSHIMCRDQEPPTDWENL